MGIALQPGRLAPLVASLACLSLLAAAPARADGQGVRVVSDTAGQRLVVDGKEFMVYGMNWDYYPVGTNYRYGIFAQPEDIIKEALDREMPLLKRMGVNAIRAYVERDCRSGVCKASLPGKWIQYIYEKWGIYTMVNHTAGRYGLTIDGVWMPAIDYSNPKIRQYVKGEVAGLVEELKGTPGVLMWLLGNENNYGLSWSSFEIENLPAGERDAAKAKFLYSLFGEIIQETHAKDPGRPVAIANGDLQYLDLIASECKGLDILGTNVYRGKSSGDLFQKVKEKLGVPVMYTEFGADAFDAKRGREDDVTQARYLLAQWQEIYEQSSGKGRVGNAIGGFIFQWADGWWKYNQETHLDVHDTNASWSNGGYVEDFVPGANNMNEEWWGICAKGLPDARGMFDLYPRTAYYVLQEAFKLQPYAATTSLAAVKSWFSAIEPTAFAGTYRADKASQAVEKLGMVRVSNLTLNFTTFSTGGSRISTPESASSTASSSAYQPAPLPAKVVPAFKGFDHMESANIDFEVKPADNFTGTLALNVLGNVAQNPIDQIFYENRGLPVRVVTDARLTGTADLPAGLATRDLTGIERLRIYKSAVSWDEPYFHLEGFFRAGHYHWGYEGDFFGVYREANYGANLDIYNGDAPLGVEVAFKQEFEGLKVAFGPQLWWGANPAIMAKYQHTFQTPVGPIDFAVIHQEQVSSQNTITTSAAIPEQKTRKTTLYAAKRFGEFNLEIGGIWAGSNKVGDCDPRVYGQSLSSCFKTEDQGFTKIDHVRFSDTFGAKAKLTWESGLVHWYAQGAYMGLVADGGPTQTITFTGWSLKDSGSGNQRNVLTGVAWNYGWFQFGPNFLWQKPIIGPGPGYSSPVRSILGDPFVVRGNREQMAAEFMLVFDPTPGTWMWAWDNDLREDAPFAASLDFVYRHQPSCPQGVAGQPPPVCLSQDAALGVLADGTLFAFAGSPPRRDLWETNLRVVAAPRDDLRVVGHAYVGTGEPNGDDPRLIHRLGADVRVTWRQWALTGYAKFNDWGPYDYHKDYNLTFPVQLSGDVAYTLGAPRWLWLNQTRVGMRATSRWLNGYSPRFVPDPADPSKWGQEWEIRTYMIVTL
jgi:beta-galactosidase